MHNLWHDNFLTRDHIHKKVPCLNTTTEVSPISSTCTISQWPASSGEGGINFGRAVACVAWHNLLRSNLDINLTTIMLYLLQKWTAMSAALPPVTITLQPVSAMDLIWDSKRSSSPLLKLINSSALLIRTVPYVNSKKRY